MVCAEAWPLAEAAFHDDIGKRGDQLLFVSEFFAEFLNGCAGTLQEDFLGVGNHDAVGSQRTFARFLEGRAGENFVGELEGCGDQSQLAAHGALHQHLNDEHAIDFVGAFEDAIDA
jgi:hypothetical protein